MHQRLASTKVIDLVRLGQQPPPVKTKAPKTTPSTTPTPTPTISTTLPQRNATVEALQRQHVEMADLQQRGTEMKEKLLKLLGEANTSFAKFPSPITAPVCPSFFILLSPHSPLHHLHRYPYFFFLFFRRC
jgi:hypothetical protein